MQEQDIVDVLDLQALLAQHGDGYSAKLIGALIDWRDSSGQAQVDALRAPTQVKAKRGKAAAADFEPTPDPSTETSDSDEPDF